MPRSSMYWKPNVFFCAPQEWLALSTFILVSCIFAVGHSAAQQAIDSNWSLLRSATVDLSKTPIDIRLPENARRTSAVRLIARKGSITLGRVAITYDNGQVHFEDRTILLKQGERTRPIDPRDETLIVERVELHLRTTVAQQAEIEVWGFAPSEPLNALAGNTDGPAVAHSQASSSDEPIHVVVAVDKSAASVIRRIRVSPDGKLVALGDDDGFIRVLDFARFELLQSWKAHPSRVGDLDFSPDSKEIVSAGWDGAARFWSARTGKPSRPELIARGEILYSVRLNPDRQYVLAGTKSGRLIAWNVARQTIIMNQDFHGRHPVLAVGYRPGGGGTYISAGGDGLLKMRLPEGQRQTVKAHNKVVFGAGFSSSGRWLYTVGDDRILKLWDPRQPLDQPFMELEGHLQYLLSADMSADETQIASGGRDKAINVYKVPSGELSARLVGHAADIESLAFTPNGKFIVSASEDKSVRIWSVEAREELARLYFNSSGKTYVGITSEQQYFGDLGSGLLTVYVDGRIVSERQAGDHFKYLAGR
jgi:WD40 repeat protein